MHPLLGTVKELRYQGSGHIRSPGWLSKIHSRSTRALSAFSERKQHPVEHLTRPILGAVPGG